MCASNTARNRLVGADPLYAVRCRAVPHPQALAHGLPMAYGGLPAEHVAFIGCHDNKTTWDQIVDKAAPQVGQGVGQGGAGAGAGAGVTVYVVCAGWAGLHYGPGIAGFSNGCRWVCGSGADGGRSCTCPPFVAQSWGRSCGTCSSEGPRAYMQRWR